jgi:hypothetical protein
VSWQCVYRTSTVPWQSSQDCQCIVAVFTGLSVSWQCLQDWHSAMSVFTGLTGCRGSVYRTVSVMAVFTGLAQCHDSAFTGLSVSWQCLQDWQVVMSMYLQDWHSIRAVCMTGRYRCPRGLPTQLTAGAQARKSLSTQT